MNSLNSTNINGYLEGYYGNLLNWSNRRRILRTLSELNFNHYFYCPKEDLHHRLLWRKSYPQSWLKSFNRFCFTAEKLNIKILIGIAPGIDFDFNNYDKDFDVLFNKIKQILNKNICQIVLMFDDISDDFSKKFPNIFSEGKVHAKLANDLSERIKKNIFVVPRVYSDDLGIEQNDYLTSFCNTINKKSYIFYCGRKIVAETNNYVEFKKISKLTNNKIIFWDNIYANDYCPRRLFLGPYYGRSSISNTFLNLTGMIETDIFLLHVIKNSISIQKDNLRILNKFKIPVIFKDIEKYFLTINNKYPNKFINKSSLAKDLENLDFLLWKWKTPLSLEWYPYILGLKQDLLLLYNKISIQRVNKIQTVPFTKIIKKLWGN